MNYTTHQQSHKLTALASSLLALLTVTSVHAANECSLEYGFNTLVGVKQEPRTATVSINAGETKTINQAKALFAKNTGANPVLIDFTGKVNIRKTLNSAQREPAAGSHPEPTLTVVTCNAPTNTTLSRSPVVISPTTPSTTATQIPVVASPTGAAAALQKSFMDSPTGLIRGLKLAGKNATEIAVALKTTFPASVPQAASLFKAEGFTAEQVAQALRKAYDPSALTSPLGSASVPRQLKTAGYAVEDITRALKTVYDLTPSIRPESVTKVLKDLGFTAEPVARALITVYTGITDENMVSTLNTAGYTVVDEALILKTVYSLTIGNAVEPLKSSHELFEVASGLKDGYQVTPQAVANALTTYGLSIRDVNEALQRGLKLTNPRELGTLLSVAGYSPTQLVQESVRNGKNLLPGSNIQVPTFWTALMLAGAGHSAEQVAVVLKNDLQASVNDAAAALKRADFTLQQIADVLKTIYQATPQVAATTLKTAGYTLTEVVSVLRTVFSVTTNDITSSLTTAGYNLAEIVGILKNTLNVNAQVAADALKFVGYTREPVRSALTTAGYAASDVTAAITSAYP